MTYCMEFVLIMMIYSVLIVNCHIYEIASLFFWIKKDNLKTGPEQLPNTTKNIFSNCV